MLSNLLTSSYLQYKTDTDTVASWLAATARKCGYAVDLLTKGQTKSAAGSGRLKGKARKQARSKETSTSSAPKPSLPTYTIAIKDFTTLADFIAAYKGRVQVPESFASAIYRAISARKSHGSAVSADLPQNEENAASDDRHSYFVGVLEHVRDTLRPFMPADFLGRQEKKGKAADTEKLANSFERLEVYDVSEEFLNAPDAARPAPNVDIPSDVRYEAERLDDFQEAMFQFQLLLQDISKIRNVVKETWIGYQSGAFDLVSASLTTNTAVDIARSMEEDAKPVLTKHGGSAKLLQLLYIGLCLERGEDPNYKERPTDDMNFKTYDFAETISWPTFQILNAFDGILEDNKMPIYKSGYYGTYDPSRDRSKMAAREKFQEDKIVLMELLPEFCVLCRGTDRVPAEDELINNLRMMFQTHEIPLRLVFAAQLLLDAHHALRGDVRRGYDTLSLAAQQIELSITQIFTFHESLKIGRVETWPRENDFVLRQLLSRIDDWVKKDPIQEAKRRLRQAPGEPFKLMKSHPAFSGLWLYSLRALYQEIGITFVGAWGSVMYAGHLYNALRQENLLKTRWDDMELVMALHRNFFIGGRPKTHEDYLKRFALSMGLSASELAKNKRSGGGRLQHSKKGPRGLTELAPVAQMFKDRYCHSEGRSDLTTEDLENILSRGLWEEEEEESQAASKDGENVRVFGRNEPMQEEQLRRRLRFTTPQQLLRALRNSLCGEAPELIFDYLSLHKVCWFLLRHVNEACRPRLNEIFGPMYIEKQTQLPFVVGYIFLAAAGADKLGSILAKKKQAVVTSALMVQATEVFEFLFNEVDKGFGSIVTRMMKDHYGIDFEIE